MLPFFISKFCNKFDLILKKEKGPSLVRCTQCALSAEGLYYFVILLLSVSSFRYSSLFGCKFLNYKFSYLFISFKILATCFSDSSVDVFSSCLFFFLNANIFISAIVIVKIVSIKENIEMP